MAVTGGKPAANPPHYDRLTPSHDGVTVRSNTGEPTAAGFPAQRLRVSRGSAADPLNLLQVMLAKGWLFARLFRGQVAH